MTPERKAYLAKCSKREKKLRRLLKSSNKEIKRWKRLIASGACNNEEVRNYYCHQISAYKAGHQALRHELARLKGMDRVVVPKVEGNPPVYYCKCGHIVGFYEYVWFNEETYCSDCGRRILWEGVK